MAFNVPISKIYNKFKSENTKCKYEHNRVASLQHHKHKIGLVEVFSTSAPPSQKSLGYYVLTTL
jgi:hypothetical protein